MNLEVHLCLPLAAFCQKDGPQLWSIENQEAFKGDYRLDSPKFLDARRGEWRMIARRERISPCGVANEFKAWASLFSSEVFVKLVAYVDESGTHSGPGSEVLIIGGWVALRDEWAQFCKDWQRVLNKHSAKYFHFKEWSEASAVVRKKGSHILNLQTIHSNHGIRPNSITFYSS